MIFILNVIFCYSIIRIWGDKDPQFSLQFVWYINNWKSNSWRAQEVCLPKANYLMESWFVFISRSRFKYSTHLESFESTTTVETLSECVTNISQPTESENRLGNTMR